MIKQIFLDTETTGVDPMKNGLYQIGGIIRYDKVQEEFEFNCDIFEEDEVDPKAFESTSVCPNDLRRYPDPYETYQEFIKLLGKHISKFDKKDKLMFINFGAEFDSKFLRRWFESNGDQYFGSWFWHPPVEVQSLAMEFLKNERSIMPNFQLSTVCKGLGIFVNDRKTHTALYDAGLAMQVYDLVTEEKIEYRNPNDDVPF
jgi:DNA polymerase-3 subunit epsilon